MISVATIPTAIALLALLGAVLFTLRPYLPRRERPSRIIGKHLRISEIQGPARFSQVLNGVVEDFDALGYRVRLTSSVELGGGTVSIVHLTARHRGYPISSASNHGVLAVCGNIGGSLPFIARINVVRV
jgi:hypothetical protein